MTFRKLNGQSGDPVLAEVSMHHEIFAHLADGFSHVASDDLHSSSKEEEYEMELACLDAFELEKIAVREEMSRFVILQYN